MLRRLKGLMNRVSSRSNVVFPGSETQFDGCSDEWDEQSLVIGLDFGTAYTKAVIGESRTHYVVPMSGAGNNKNYLARSAFYLLKDGTASLSQTSSDAKYVTDLKMPLLLDTANDDDLARIAIFMALCFRRIRYWLLTEHKDTYGDQLIDWAVNVGIPTDSFENNGLNQSYRRCCNVAWALSLIPGPIKFGHAHALLSAGPSDDQVLYELSIPKERLLHPELISLFPEFLAQIAGYVRSPMRQSDLHMLVDVGAGTLDATVFNVHDIEGDDVFPRFARSVSNLGTNFLIKHRLELSASAMELKLADFDPVPKAAHFAERIGISHGFLDQLDAPYRSRVYSAVGDLLLATKVEMYKRSPRWKTGVPVFLTGGGANVDFYQEVLRKFQLEDTLKIVPRTLPTPTNLTAPGLDEKDYGRLSVAYGLSFDPDDLGRSEPSEPDDGSSQIRSQRSWEANYVDSSMV